MFLSSVARDATRSTQHVIHSAILLLLLLALCPGAAPTHASVTLVSFTAIAGDGQILLAWETATELDNAGFFVRRSTEEAGEYARISPFIPAQGDGLIGAVYTYLDEDVAGGVGYYYLLEAIGNDQTTQLHGPVSATVGQPATETPTATPVSPPTATATPTMTPSPTPTPRSTATPTPTTTPSPTPTVTLTATPGTSPSPTATPTATPAATPTPTSPPTSTPTTSATLSPSPTRTWTPTATPLPTQTATPYSSATATRRPTATPRPTRME